MPAKKAGPKAQKAAPPLPKAADPLQNPKHEAVLQAYFADKTRLGWRAWQHVYVKSTQRAAETSFSRLLKTAEFSSRLGHLDAAVAAAIVDDTVMSSREVLQELSKLGRSSIKKLIVRGDNTADVIESLDGIPDEDAATIKALTIETYVEGGGEDAREVKRIKVELHDKRGPLRDLAQHHGLLTEKHEHTGKDGGPIEHEHKQDEISDLELGRRIAFALE